MKKLLLLLFFSLTLPLRAQFTTSTPSPHEVVLTAQRHLWETQAQLNDAALALNWARADWDRSKLADRLAKAQAAGDHLTVESLQKQIADLDHRKDLEKQKHDLNAQIFQAQQDGDQGKVDSLRFQLKELQ